MEKIIKATVLISLLITKAPYLESMDNLEPSPDLPEVNVDDNGEMYCDPLGPPPISNEEEEPQEFSPPQEWLNIANKSVSPSPSYDVQTVKAHLRKIVNHIKKFGVDDLEKTMHQNINDPIYQSWVVLFINREKVAKIPYKNGYNILHSASAQGHTALVKFMVNKYALINTKDDKGLTPLYYACKNGHTKVAQILLENGATSLTLSEYKMNLFHIAVQNKHEAIVRLLIEKIDTATHIKLFTQKNCTNKRAIDVAREKKFIGIIKLFEDATPSQENLNKQLLKIAMRENFNADDFIQTKALLESGANINTQNKEGHTILWHCALKRQNIEAVKYLLSQNADVTLKNTFGDTTAELIQSLIAILKSPKTSSDYSEIQKNKLQAIIQNNEKILKLLKEAEKRRSLALEASQETSTSTGPTQTQGNKT